MMTAKSLLPGMLRALVACGAMQGWGVASALDLEYSYHYATDFSIGKGETRSGWVYDFRLVSDTSGTTFQDILIGDIEKLGGVKPLSFSFMSDPTQFANGFSVDGGVSSSPEASHGKFTEQGDTLTNNQLAHTGWLLSFGTKVDGDGWLTKGSTNSPATVSWTGLFQGDAPLDVVHFSYSFPADLSESRYHLGYNMMASNAPEPGTYALMLLGLACIGGMKARRHRLLSAQA